MQSIFILTRLLRKHDKPTELQANDEAREEYCIPLIVHRDQRGNPWVPRGCWQEDIGFAAEDSVSWEWNWESQGADE